MAIQKAVKYDAKLRLALYGPSGSGKTFTSLAIARDLSTKRVCVIDTERKSASKYADKYDFDVINLGNYHPKGYIEAIREVIQAKEYDVLVIDSTSHEWEGAHGALELVGGNFTNWTTVTPLHNQFIDAMLNADIHLIVTMRAKEEHVMEKEEGKKAVIKKMGMEPIQRKGVQYEFDIVAALGMDNVLSIEKTRCSDLKDQTFAPGNEQAMVDTLSAWLSGEVAPTLLDIIPIYERGKVTEAWTKESFFTVASGMLSGFPVSSDNYKKLSQEQLKILQEAVEREPLSLIS